MPDPARLQRHYERILDERMHGLDFLNPKLSVEAVGFRPLGEHSVGVLITPWFMNLVLLPGSDEWDALPPGGLCRVELPAGQMEFNAGGDDGIGRLLTAVLFTTVADFPDHATARDVAIEILERLFSDAATAAQQVAPKMTRRAMFSAARGD
jgi:[NiFe] hydrogenase assembly HybE family chaperone